MSGLGGQERKGSLRTFHADLPESIDGIVDKVREIILKGDVESIVIKTGEPIAYQRTVSEGVEVPEDTGELTFVGLTLAEIVRNIAMEEFVEPGLRGLPPQALFFWMYYFVEHEGWSPAYLLLGEASTFWAWIGLGKKRGRDSKTFMGLKVERDKSLPADIFLICGAKHKGAAITEVEYVLKGNVEAFK